MNAPFRTELTARELRWLRHIAVHGPQSSEFLLELVADTHRCKDTGLRTLQKLRQSGYLRLPPQQRSIAKADFNPYVYDLTRRAELYLNGLGDPETVRPTGHWWHAFLTASITSTIDIEAGRRGYRYIPAHEILGRSGATLAIPLDKQKLIPDQLFAIDYGGKFRSFAVEVDRSTEPARSKSARKSLKRMVTQYAALAEKDTLRGHYNLKSPLLHLFVFTAPNGAARCMEFMNAKAGATSATNLVGVVPPGFARYAPLQKILVQPWSRAHHEPLGILL